MRTEIGNVEFTPSPGFELSGVDGFGLDNNSLNGANSTDFANGGALGGGYWTTYNFEVEEYHTYIADGMRVHNDSFGLDIVNRVYRNPDEILTPGLRNAVETGSLTFSQSDEDTYSFSDGGRNNYTVSEIDGVTHFTKTNRSSFTVGGEHQYSVSGGHYNDDGNWVSLDGKISAYGPSYARDLHPNFDEVQENRNGDSGGDNAKPIILDLDSDGIELSQLDESTAFYDINGESYRQNVAWASADDGFLVVDIGGDGIIDQKDELVFVDYVEGAETDLEGLAYFDTNGDGVLNALDTATADKPDAGWEKFGVWQDLDQDGETDAGEFQTLDALGITEINLTSDEQQKVFADGTVFHGLGEYTRDGSTHVFADAALAASATGFREEADGTVKIKAFGETSRITASTETDVDGNTIPSTVAVTLDVSDQGDDVIGHKGGAGDDTLSAGVAVGISLEGGAGNDTLNGSYGDDWLVGGEGADTIRGGAGNDVLFTDADDWATGAVEGGKGFDQVFITAAETDTAGATLTLTDGGQGDGLEAIIGTDLADTIDATALSGPMVLDGAGGDDTIIGTTGNDQLSGSAGDDDIAGGDGDDVLIGGGGTDDLDGGVGNDVLYADVADFAGGATLLGGDGNDLLAISGGDGETVDEVTGDPVAETGVILDMATLQVESVLGSRGDDTIDGSTVDYAAEDLEGVNIFGDAGDDTLTGGSGNDLLEGGEGADTLVGGTGIDQLAYLGSREGVTINLGTGEASGGDAEGDVFSGIERVSGSLLGDTLTGDDTNNLLEGLGGSDVLVGGAGADTLDGGSGLDTADYAGSAAAVTVTLRDDDDGTGSGGDAEGDALVSIENLVGSAHDDTLTGDGGINTLEGGAGADDLDGGAGRDTVDYGNSAAGVTLALSGSNWATGVGGEAEGDRVRNVESIFGSDHADTLTGDGQNNTLIGGDGDDILVGLTGDDLINGGTGADDLQGGDGIDTVSYVGSEAGVTVDLAAGTASGGDAEAGETISGFENVRGSAEADVLTGDAGDNVIEGGYGGDTLTGGDGVDTLSYSRAFRGVSVDLSRGEGRQYVEVAAAAATLSAGAAVGTGLGGFTLGGAGLSAAFGQAMISDDWSVASVSLDRTTMAGDGWLVLTDAAASVGDGLPSNAAHMRVQIGDAQAPIEADESIGQEAVARKVEIISDTGAVKSSFDLGAFDPAETTLTVAYNKANGQLMLFESHDGPAESDPAETQTNAKLVGMFAFEADLDVKIGVVGDAGISGEFVDAVGFAKGLVAASDEVNDTFTGFENLEGSLFDDVLTGDAAANELQGLLGNDVLDGGDGDDTLIGGAGHDVLTGGAGADHFDLRGNDGVDGITDFDAAAGDTMSISALDPLGLILNIEEGDTILNYGSGAVLIEGAEVTDILSNASVGIDFDDFETIALESYNYGYTNWAPVQETSGAVVGYKDGGSTSYQVVESDFETFSGFRHAETSGQSVTGADGSDIITVAQSVVGANLSGGRGNDVYVVGADNGAVTITDSKSASWGQTTKTVHWRERIQTDEGPDWQSKHSSYSYGHSATYHAGVDMVLLDPTLTSDDVAIHRSGRDLKIVVEDAQYVNATSITISNVDGWGSGVEYLRMGDEDILLTGDQSMFGTQGNDTLGGSEEADHMELGAGNDTGRGSDGDDVIYGRSGDDILVGGAGADTLKGGLGTDTASWEDAVEAVQTSLVEGTSSEGDVLESIENLTGSQYGDLLIGDENVNRIDGGKGDDVLHGGGGADEFVVFYEAGATDLIRDFTPGEDRLLLDHPSGYTRTATVVDGNTEIIVNPGASEHKIILRGVTLGTTIFDSAHSTTSHNGVLPTTVSLSEGDDVHSGNSGPEIIKALGGDDLIHGSNGADVIRGGDGNDTLSYAGLSGDTVANLQTGFGRGSDFITGVENLTGGAGNDSLSGDDQDNRLEGGAGNDWLRGGAGDDTLVAGAGFDTLDGGEGFDTVDYSGEAAGLNLSMTTVLDQPEDTSLQWQDDKLIRIEGLIGSAFDDIVHASNVDNTLWGGLGGDWMDGRDGNDTLYGEEGDDDLKGGAGNDTVYGGVGNDLLEGGIGDDVLEAGDGDDWLAGGLGVNSIDGGLGSDTASWYDFTGFGVTISLVDNTARYIDPETGLEVVSTLVSIEHLHGSELDDHMTGNDADNTLYSQSGDDTVYGMGGADDIWTADGNDWIDGGDGDDIINSHTGDDTVYGGAGADEIFAAEGNDTVHGGAGADRLNGYLGDDILYGDDGDDGIWGDAGDDWIDGGLGADHLNGGDGVDTVSYASRASGMSISLATNTAAVIQEVTGVVTAAVTQEDTLTFFENIEGTDHTDLIVGNTGANELWGGAGNDTVHGYEGDDILHGGAGNDTLNGWTGIDHLHGGDGDDEILAGAGNDIITGGAGIDTIDGQEDDDQIHGGAGDDLIDGGDGNDIILGGSGIDSIEGGLGDDTITGGVGDDLIWGEDGNDLIYAGDGVDTINAGAGLDTVSYVNAAAGVTAKLDNDDLLNGDILNGVEVLVGSGFADTLDGSTTDDTLDGGDGNDLLRGGAGADTLIGGLGDDQLQGADGGDLLQGGSGDDQLYAHEGEDTLEGGDGNDVLQGGTGADTLDGGAGAGDEAIYYGSSAVTIDLVAGTGTGGDAEGDTLSGIEILKLTEHADTATGSAADETFYGNAGDDVLSGGAGADSLYGETGDDLLDGGAGADALDGGDGIDTVTYAAAAAGVVVSLAAQSGSAGDALGDSLVNVENLTGSAFDDTLTGDGAGNRLEGGAGDDLLVGGQGADTLIGGDGHDTAGYADLGYGVTVDLSAGTSGDGDTLSGIESLIGTDYGDALTGDTDANRLDGGGGNDVLSGGAGNDTLTGGAGTNTLNGGDGDDVFIGGAGDDTFDGGAGFDTVDYSASAAGVGISVDTNGQWGSGDNLGDGYAGIEKFILTDHDDMIFLDGVATEVEAGDGNDSIRSYGGSQTLYGGAGNDDIEAGADADTVYGGLGNDDIEGDWGADTLHGGDGNDIIDAGGDDDTVYGDAGDDTIIGGIGYDTIYGGTGNDTLRTADGGSDHVDGGDGIDTLDVSDSTNTSGLWIDLDVGGGVGNTSEGDALHFIENIIGTAYGDHLEGDDGVNQLDGGDGDDDLFGQGGNDILNGGAGADTIHGGDGDDTITLGAGVDTAYAGDGADTIHATSGADTIHGQGGDDTVHLSDDGGTVYAGSGDDTVYGGSGGDDLHGNAGADTLYGYAGNDFLYGNDGDDTLDAGDGTNNYADGGAGNDTVIGGTGNDTLKGGDGDDILIGGAGWGDWLEGNGGSDTFVFKQGDQLIKVVDFSLLEDKIDVRDWGYADFAAVQADLSQDGTTAWLGNYSDNDWVEILNVDHTALTASHFLIN